jgi:hypothetical protein
MIGYLERGGMWGKEDLEAGRTRKFFWAILIFKQARLGHLVINSSLFDCKNLARSSNILQSM